MNDYIRTRAKQRLKTKLPEFTLELWKVGRTMRYGTGNPDPAGRAATAKWEAGVKEIGRILSSCVIMECKENKGVYVPRIIEALELLMSTPLGWPGTDRKNKVLTANWRYAGLGTLHAGASLTAAAYLLDDKLPQTLREKIKGQVKKWCLDPVCRALRVPFGVSTATIDYGNWIMSWVKGTNNITPYSYRLTLFMAYAYPMSRTERAWLTANAIAASNRYLNSFTKSGYTAEGIGYWQMGFSSWLELADFIRTATDGKVDMIQDPKVQNIVALGYNMLMAPGGLYPHFSDHGVAGRPTPQSRYFYNLLNNFSGIDYYGTEMKNLNPFSPGGVSLWRDLFSTFSMMKTGKALKPAPERKAYFFDPESHILVSRDAQFDSKDAFSFAMKGGHNGEHHNHNDLGSFVIGVGKYIHCGDPGVPPYTARSRRIIAASGMHPVPLVNGRQQSGGGRFAAKVKSFKADKNSVALALDLKGAYAEPLLKSLVRTGMHDRNKKLITLTDEFEFSKRADFGSCLITYYPVKQLDKKTWQIGKLKAEFSATAPIEFKFETPALEWRSKEKASRLSYKFKDPAVRGKVTVSITPLK